MARATLSSVQSAYSVSLIMAVAFAVSGDATAMAKKPSIAPETPLSGKRVIQVNPVRNVRIEMPDGGLHDFGGNFSQRLETVLHESGRYVYSAPPVIELAGRALGTRSDSDGSIPGYEWSGSAVPAATLTIEVEAMSFQTGSRGGRMFYGFNERFRTPFNDGYTDSLGMGTGNANEFPLKVEGEAGSADSSDSKDPSWFDNTFHAFGDQNTGSRSGLDIGDGFTVDALFAWLAVKYATYHAELHLRLTVDAPFAGVNEHRMISVSGEGFFYDIAGAYQGYSAGIRIARRDAMSRAMDRAISGIYSAIDRAVAPLPLAARIDSILPDGTVLLGTGGDAQVVPGTVYEMVGVPEVRIEAYGSTSSGTMARLVSGPAEIVTPGALLREALPGLPSAGELAQQKPRADLPAAIEQIELPWANLDQADLGALAPLQSAWDLFWARVAGTFTLPYRIWRYYQYDRVLADAPDKSKPAGYWQSRIKSEEWAKRIGLDRAPAMKKPTKGGGALPPVVAVIDSGVDYNHWALHGNLWMNPAPISLEGSGLANRLDRYGYDFISGDSHAYDDHWHGTEVASVVVGIAPQARIMPLKVFNPWGITSSAAIYGAFVYAVDHGAQVIVCGWATRVQSRAIEQGVAYAREHGVAVVAAAGDRGQALDQEPAYPAALSERYDNVLTVYGIDADSNYGPRFVGLAAPAWSILSATPRSWQGHDSTSGLAAAQVAGALARVAASLGAVPQVGSDFGGSNGTGVGSGGTPADWIAQLRADAEVAPELDGKVAGSLLLKVRR